MTTPAVQRIEGELAETLVKLHGSKDPAVRRALLKQMRTLIAELDRIVLDSNPSKVESKKYVHR